MAENGLFWEILSSEKTKRNIEYDLFLCKASKTGINFRNSLKLCKGDGHFNRPLSLGGNVESQEDEKLSFCTESLALNSRMGEACRAKTKLFILLRFNMAAE